MIFVEHMLSSFWLYESCKSASRFRVGICVHFWCGRSTVAIQMHEIFIVLFLVVLPLHWCCFFYLYFSWIIYRSLCFIRLYILITTGHFCWRVFQNVCIRFILMFVWISKSFALYVSHVWLQGLATRSQFFSFNKLSMLVLLTSFCQGTFKQ